MQCDPRTLRAIVTAVTLCAADVSLAQGKLNVSESVELSAPVARTWAVIKDFDQWQRWHPAITGTEIVKGRGNNAGTVRLLTTRDGQRISEELLAYSDKLMSYRYRIVESTLPVAQYVSTIKVVKGRGVSVIVWRGSFNAAPGVADAEARRVITGIYLAGFDGLKKRLPPPEPPKPARPGKPAAKPGDKPPADVSKPGSKPSPGTAPKDTPKSIPKDTPKSVPKDAPKSVPQETPARPVAPAIKDAPVSPPKPPAAPVPRPSPAPPPSPTTTG